MTDKLIHTKILCYACYALLLLPSFSITLQKQVGYLNKEWLPWLQTNWRDSGYKRFALELKT